MRAAALVAAAALLLGACGGGQSHATPRSRSQAGAPPAAVPVQVIPGFALRAGGSRSVALPSPAWVASFDAQGPLVVRAGAWSTLLTFAGRGWRHVEATSDSLSVAGRTLGVRPGRALTLTFSAPSSGRSSGRTSGRTSGRASVRGLIISAAADRGALLLHRLAELHARVPVRRFPEGADLADRIHYGDTYWTSGFWPGALWAAAALEPSGAMFARWALAATVAHFGQERANTHDVGFMYGESSLAAWQALCSQPSQRVAPSQGVTPSQGVAVCPPLRRSALRAAGKLVALERTNDRAGTIPTNSTSGDTIVDSMMNIAILPWASRISGNPVFRAVAARHAHRVAALLVRRDGSTAQSVNFDRVTGKVLFVSTHQGLSNQSTWSRGQGWAVYGFSDAAASLHDRSLLQVALRTAGYVSRHLPGEGIPRWDYNAPPGAPVDVSAGVITAAGLMHLAGACRSFGARACARPEQWAALGRRMLSAALTRASPAPPLGFLRDQVLNQRGRGCWCDGGELIFGLTYALEGLKLASGR